ncbi:hypothetical protein BsWGS_10905 [Bradybaena similaris]
MAVYLLMKLLCLISCFQEAGALPSCHLGELGRPYTFTSDIGGNHSKIEWRKSTYKIATCDLTECNGTAHAYVVTVSSGTSTLTIRNVTTLDIGIYHCHVDKNLSIYNFNVFGTPEYVRCTDAEFYPNISTIALTCTVWKVYPYPSCQFMWLLNETKSKITHKGRVDYTNETESANPDYFNVNCSLELRGQDFQLGSHSFYLSVDQGVIGCKHHEIHITNSTRTKPRYVGENDVCK